MIELLHPYSFALLIPLAGLAVWTWRSSRGIRTGATAFVQLILAAVILLGLTGLRSRSTTRLIEPSSLVVVEDVSQSMRSASPLESFDAAGRIKFANEARWSEDTEAGELQPHGSNPARAVALASATGASAIVLHSDGRETVGDLELAAMKVGRPLFIVPLNEAQDACLLNASASPVQRHREIAVDTTITSNFAGPATLTAAIDGRVPVEREVQLDVGRNQTTLSFPAKLSTDATIELRLRAANDTHEDNNRFTLTWHAAADARVTIVRASASPAEPLPVKPLTAALQAAGYAVRVVSSGEFDPQSAEEDAGVIVLGALDAEQQARIEPLVERGLGLIVVGGESVFGPKPLADSTWKNWLPVTFSAVEKVQTRPASFAMVLVIDKSESMLQENRLEMAKQAAKQTVQSLAAEDQVGVLAFGTETEWVSELTAAGDKNELLQRIESLEVAGETNMQPAIERAQLALEQNDAEHRHLILLTDGVSSPGAFQATAKQLREEGISVATVSVGSGAEQLILKDIARFADGKHYHCESATDLPNILARATEQATTAIGPRTFQPFTLEGGLNQLDMAAAPPLTGVVATTPKDDTTLAYLTDDGQPLIVWRVHEKGQVAAVICDPESILGASWQGWSANAKFWQALTRHVESQPPLDPVRIQSLWRDDRVTVQVDIRDSDRWVNDAEVDLRLDRQGDLRLPLVAAGRYEEQLTTSLAQPGDGKLRGTLRVRYQDGRVIERPWSVAPNVGVELTQLSVDRERLRAAAELTQGKLIAGPEEIPAELLAPRTRTVSSVNPLWRWAAAAAIILLLLETFTRRWSLRFGVIG